MLVDRKVAYLGMQRVEELVQCLVSVLVVKKVEKTAVWLDVNSVHSKVVNLVESKDSKTDQQSVEYSVVALV